MDNQPHILIACPVSQHKEYCLWQWLAHVKHGLTYPNYSLLLVDNSEDPAFHLQLRAAGYDVLRVEPQGRNARAFIAESFEVIRQEVLKRKAAYHLSLECDLFPPANIIERLLAHATVRQKPVVGAPYLILTGSRATVCSMEKYQLTNGREDHRIMHPAAGFLYTDGSFKQTFHISNGCVLISAKVYEVVKYWWQKGQQWFQDTNFYIDIFKQGIEVWGDYSLMIEHRNTDWRGIKSNYA